ncbi:MAG TPA: FIST N-terminal domain-containing protein [Polyangia bacterium]
MQTFASNVYSLEPDSSDAGRLAAQKLKAEFGPERLKAVLVYATMNHDHAPLLEAFRAELPEDVLVVGTSGQGVVGGDELSEEGMVLGVMGFGGDALRAATAVERDVQVDSKEKGRAMARSLKEKLGAEPKVIITFYDPLCGIDVESLIAGMRMEVACPIAGAGSGQPWGVPRETVQFMETEVLSHGAVALALNGPFTTEIGLSHGTVSNGIRSVATKTEGNVILEIDGRPAVEVWREVTGCRPDEIIDQSHFAIWALGVERTASIGGEEKVDRVIRGAFGIEPQSGGIILQAAVPEGTGIMFHHRTAEEVLQGTTKMANELQRRLHGRSPWAVLGFECAARTYPFLGPVNTRAEHKALRAAIGPKAPWLGMMAWGEIGPCLGQTAFHNYTYPLVTFLGADA